MDVPWALGVVVVAGQVVGDGHGVLGQHMAEMSSHLPATPFDH